MKVFVNYLENIPRVGDTDLIYPKNLLKLSNYFNITLTTNHSRLQPLLLAFIRRLKITRLHSYLKNIPHDEVYVSEVKVRCADLMYCSYIYPKFFGKSPALPKVLRINYQTDKVLLSRNVKKLKKWRVAGSKRWNYFDAVITTTSFSVKHIQEYIPENVKVYYCPFFLPDASPLIIEEFKRKLQLSAKINFLFVGRDGIRKGLNELEQALHLLPEKVKNSLHFTIVSQNEPDKKKLVGIEFDYYPGLSNVEVLKKMMQAHVFCLPTKSEAYGIVFIEAMSQGCAIIADDDLPRLEFVRDNQAGICVNPENSNQIIEAIEKMVLDHEFRNTCMQNSLEAFKSQFAPDVVARRHQEIFEEVIRKSKFD